jgi:hypothetical protein
MGRMRELAPTPMSASKKATIEAGMPEDDVLALECSNHGFTVGTDHSAVHLYGCRVHAALMFLAMPVGTVMLWNLLMGRAWVALVHACAIAFPVYLTVHHDKYHATADGRRAWAAARPSWPERWLWACWAMDTATEEHLEHHHDRSGRERYFGLVPGGSFAVYPVWQTW